MPRRAVDIDGERWEVVPSGRVTRYDRDEFSLTFIRGTGPDRERRVARYSPGGCSPSEAVEWVWRSTVASDASPASRPSP
jgi:hypothetical protein